MKYLYMDNYRGFSKTIVPVSGTSFLVGENSTGKSSLLKLMYLFSKPDFFLKPADSLNELVDMGSFEDIVSAFSKDKSFFKVGFAEFEAESEKTRITLLEFKSNSGAPVLKGYANYIDGRIVKCIFTPSTTKYKTLKDEKVQGSSGRIKNFILDFFESSLNDTTGYKLFPKGLPPYPPLPFISGFIQSVEDGGDMLEWGLSNHFFDLADMVWIAPIRTSPQRIYDGLRQSFSPSGEHTPFLLRSALKSRSKERGIVKKLDDFGKASGLFDAVSTRSFGTSHQAPFEVLIKFSNASLNISHVGYGVSQSLPLIVEMLSAKRNKVFSIQQPEVHLHPKAQAALGDLFHALIMEKGHELMVETHSDFLIDRFRLATRKSEGSPESRVLFFLRTPNGNEVRSITINEDGTYAEALPDEMVDFFLKEDLSLLEI